MSHIYPEIKTEVEKQQQALENLARKMAITPPIDVKAKVMEAIKHEPQEIADNTLKERASESSSAKVISMEPQASKKETKSINWAAAASVVLLIGLAGVWAISNNQIDELKGELAAVHQEMEQIADQKGELLESIDAKEQEITKSQKMNELLANQATLAIELPGTENQPDAAVRVFWNTNTKEVLMKVESLAAVPEGKQYQLWAIVDGKPTDMGVFDFEGAENTLIEVPHLVDGAQAFAITLEESGGSPTPNLDALVVIGNV